MATANTVVIVSGRMNCIATALRGYINTTLSHARMGDLDLMEESIKSMRRELTALETECRLVVTKGE